MVTEAMETMLNANDAGDALAPPFHMVLPVEAVLEAVLPSRPRLRCCLHYRQKKTPPKRRTRESLFFLAPAAHRRVRKFQAQALL